MARAEDLKQRARELFAPPLAASVIQDIEADEQRAAAVRDSDGPSIAGGGGGARIESIATGWLGDALYAQLGTGAFSGLPTVRWNGIFAADGRDQFVFMPDAAHAFSYRTSAALGAKVITPRLMTTDGGTIPRVLWGLQKFSPWGYAPGYMIHDWLFTSHKCNFGPDNAWTFEQSADILGECIKTLMEAGFTDFDGSKRRLAKAEDTLYLIHKAVGSSVAREMWNDRSSVDCRG